MLGWRGVDHDRVNFDYANPACGDSVHRSND